MVQYYPDDFYEQRNQYLQFQVLQTKKPATTDKLRDPFVVLLILLLLPFIILFLIGIIIYGLAKSRDV